MDTLSIENLSARYGATPVLREISLTLAPGQVLGLLGPNGAGKSTLVRVLSGTLAASTGRVMLGATNLLALPTAERARQVAVVPQGVQLPEGFRVAEVVLLGRSPHLPRFGSENPRDHELARLAMVHTSTWHLRDRWVSELSGGERQRVLLARALAQEPRLLLLDEATAHLDLKHQLGVLELARELASGGMLVIAVLHDLNLAALYVDRIALLHDGRLLACDTPDRVLTPEWLQRAYGVAAHVAPHPRYPRPHVALLRPTGHTEGTTDE